MNGTLNYTYPYYTVHIMNKKDIADLSQYLINNDFEFNLYKDSKVVIQMLPEIGFPNIPTAEEIFESYKLQIHLKWVDHLCTLWVNYTENLHHVEMQISKYGPLDTPNRLINEKKDIEKSIEGIKQRLSDVAHSDQFQIGNSGMVQN